MAEHIMIGEGSSLANATTRESAASDTQAGLIEIATEAEQETAADLTRAVTPGRQHRHPSAAKFWANIVNGHTTPGLNGSYNVTSITDTATGRLTVTIGTDFSGSNTWCLLAGSSLLSDVAGDEAITGFTAFAAGSIELTNRNVTPALEDPHRWCVAGFGDHS